MNTQTVASDDGGKEGAWIASLIALILLSGWVLLPFNQAKHDSSHLTKYQVSIEALAPKQLTMVADLRLAHEEIRNIYLDTQTWATVEVLQESWLAPFVKDKSWTHQGKHQWLQVAKGVYQGVPEIGAERYLLISRAQQVELWIDTKGSAILLDKLSTSKQTSLLNDVLIKNGWLQVVFQPETQHAH